MPASDKQIREFLAFGREQSAVEFKSAGALTTPGLRAKVVRAMLAMTNRRDGGVVIVGVAERDGVPQLDGLSEDDAATWKHDNLADAAAEYADPRISFSSALVDVDGARVLVIQIDEFDDAPVICRRDMTEGRQSILRSGAVYVRSNRKPESREVANYDEMRELLDVATDRGVRRFVARARSAGLDVSASPMSVLDSEAAYSAERGDL